MENDPLAVEPAPMEAGGAYNRSSKVQAATAHHAMALLEQAARHVPLPDPSVPLAIVDYGASAGRNSLAPIKAAIRVLRSRMGVEQVISVIHADLPANDFTALFHTVSEDQDSYLQGDDAVFISAVGNSFFQQILPPGSVTLGWSSWAVQWLSRMPAQIPDHVQVAYSKDTTARIAYARQAATDWQCFVQSRGRELRPGGRIVILTMARNDNGDFGYRPLLDAMYLALQGLQTTGFLGPEEVRRMAIPTVGRNRAEFLAPFSAQGDAGGLSLEHIELFEGEDWIWSQFEQDGDAAQFGMNWAVFSRASVFPTLALGLDGGSNNPRVPAFLHRLETAMAEHLALKPEPMTIPLAILVFAK